MQGVGVGANAAHEDEVLDVGPAALFEQPFGPFHIYVVEQAITASGFGTGEMDNGRFACELGPEFEVVVDAAGVGGGIDAGLLELGYEGAADEAGGAGDEDVRDKFILLHESILRQRGQRTNWFLNTPPL